MRMFIAAVASLLPLVAQTALTLLPQRVELNGPEARQQLIAEAAVSGVQEDWTRSARWSSSNPAVATVDAEGLVRPAGDGEAVITATANGLRATLQVKVAGTKAPFTWSFQNHVIPVFSKVGCNQGACHGALAGKNGFKLTLRGYDPAADYDTLVKQSLSRRVNLADPAASLILKKPAFEIPHGGGKRFAPDSLEYRVIAEWIASGAPGASANDPTVVSLEVYPASAVLKPSAEQQLAVLAKFSDGGVADVTRWVKYASSNEGAASVDDSGRVKMNGHGEAAITLWYSSRVAYARVAVPFPNQVSAASYRDFHPANLIDELTLKKWKQLNLAPSRTASDEVYLRRAYLDATGLLPAAEDVESFLADTDPAKREKLVDRLLRSEEYVDYWAYKWSELLLISTRKLRSNAMWTFYGWVRESVKNNKPWDQFAREIFTGTGSTRQNGALNYFVIHKDPIDLSENVTQSFIGQRLTCARCHNHPLEKWTQTQYYQFANLFSRVGLKNGSEPGDVVVYVKTSGDINHPRLLRPLSPAPLDGQNISVDSIEDRRKAFADWLTSPDNKLFARTIVNRVWGNFYGRGLVHPVDDLRATNPASNEELLSALTADFVKNGYDIKRLIKVILTSSTYQLSSEANATNQQDNIYYSKYIVKRLPAEVLLDAMSQVTGVATSFPGYAAGTRAVQLPDSQVPSPFLTSFGKPQRIICDASERSSDPTVAQALHVINGDTLNRKLGASDGTIALFVKLGISDTRIVEFLYLAAYSRYPTAAEKQEIVSKLAETRNAKGSADAQKEARRQGLEDMAWALMTSKEFLFNH